ncbi:reverse transcriptase domain-containing protein [Citrus sinensis]|nr:reverse transcriptase domain-containing protein [Citrus sinensis]
MWLREADCTEVVRSSWSSSRGFPIQQKILNYGTALLQWEGHLAQDFQNRISKCRRWMTLLRGRRDSAGLEEFTEIVAKMLSNRMKTVLGSVVSESQSAFVSGRAITDNILISSEIMHFLKRKRLGFDAKWVTLIMLCVSTFRYHVIRDGKEIGPIVPSRGLRQGDPLSSYLFILCAEGLSALIRKNEHAGLLHGVQASGQMVNFSKSSISFTLNVNEDVKEQFCHILEVNATANHGTYLGLPSFIGRNKKEVFSSIRGRVWQKLYSWSMNLLSGAGKEILLKIVAQAIPNYAMQVYLLPLDLCKELETMMNSFWWGSRRDGRAKHIIVRGSRIQVGSGQNTLIGSDPWLPDAANGFISTSLNEILATAPVSSLIVPGQRRWDYDAVADLFDTRDRNLILQIPLSSRRDKNVWKVWNLEVPSKVKIFLWRAAMNVLPITDNLIRKRVEHSGVINATSIQGCHGAICWTPPHPGWLKCNVDAAIFSAQGKVSYGGVIRNSDGIFVTACCTCVLGSYGARDAEALGVREILSWIKQRQLSCVVVEMDCFQVFKALTENYSCPNGYGLILDDCRALVKSIRDIEFSFVRRSANTTAHVAARVGGSLSGFGEWSHVPPPWLLTSL